ncbi:MAG: flagellar motor switch phosphatase FliY [Lachnospiraceae bacterium]|nr:flagellar motor switch phosphatase FliY [Lachnospiraceae bacterium]
MDGILSQDEINALLSGMGLSDGNDAPASEEPVTSAPVAESEPLLTDVEKDAIGEVANISMGTSATTLYSLVNRKVNITTPVVELTTWDKLIEDYERPCVFIQISYTEGLDGSNILILKEQDVKIITDLMMGGDGSNTDGELGELHLSAISEAMNQMMGSAATSMSSMLKKTIDISPPIASHINMNLMQDGGDIASFLSGTFVKISFRMQIDDDLVDSKILQLYPVEFARTLYTTFMGVQMHDTFGTPVQEAEPAPAPTPAPQPAPAPQPVPEVAPSYGMPQMGMPQMGMPQMGMPQMQMMPQMGMPQMQMMPQMGMPQMQNVNVQPAQFQTFSQQVISPAGQENMGLIMDVPLEVTVELGRTKKSIADILDFAPGTIIELDKIAGEPIDVLVNGKFVAKGEVVVIEESFGIRVTEIIK